MPEISSYLQEIAVPEIAFITLTDPAAYFAANVEILTDVTVDAFGSAAYVTRHVSEYFGEAEFGQVILHDDCPIGHALYRRLDDKILWLQGIAIRQTYQGKGLASYVVAQAMRDASVLVATTRNPATVKLINKVTGFACPDLGLSDPLRHLHDPRLQRGMKKFTRVINADTSQLPFISGRYADDLYGTDPGRILPFVPIQEDSSCAVVVVGAKT